MPDITMCINKNCKIKNACYRFKAIPSNYQSYAEFEPNKATNQKPYQDYCNHFMKILKGARLNENT